MRPPVLSTYWVLATACGGGTVTDVWPKVFLTGKGKKTGGERETCLSDFSENYRICHFDFGRNLEKKSSVYAGSNLDYFQTT